MQHSITEKDIYSDNKKMPFALPEIMTMRKIIVGIGWINLLIGLASVVLVADLHSLSLAFTGLLSILTFFLLKMVVRHLAHTKSWTEFGIFAMSGIYCPAFILWLCSGNLITAILE